jgi:cyclopropane fatty-acyl-phospholipid synthase-like methyltransferase
MDLKKKLADISMQLFISKNKYQPKQVGDFYNKNHDAFIKVYGEVIQAFRTNNLDNILNSQIDSIGLKKGQRVLDAGCGVCGPARYFAKKTGCNIDAVTISEVQLNAANKTYSTRKPAR